VSGVKQLFLGAQPVVEIAAVLSSAAFKDLKRSAGEHFRERFILFKSSLLSASLGSTVRSVGCIETTIS
jgi:hypothetical protein